MNPLTKEIEELAGSISGLARRTVAEYTPKVNAIIRTHSKDTRHIEHTLDDLLDFCFDQEALALFKKLCRHYYFIDVAAAVQHVQAYREMWDSEPDEPRRS